jgi:Type I restriction enzyme R protein N terminus (HSDR_N)
MMKDTLLDIRQKLQDSAYNNEEHVRLSLVSRVLQELGWDIWNPHEVNSEFRVLPQEDSSHLDLALFLAPYQPMVFIEVKSVGRLTGNIGRIERQLRDYNRNNTALFSIITDGQKWLFYYSQTGGEFSQKRFKALDILEDNVNDLQMYFDLLLSKERIRNGNAEREAKDYLQLSRKQRAMEDALPRAKRLVNEPPFPTLPQAVVNLTREAGYTVSIEEASQFIQENATRDTLEVLQNTVNDSPTGPGIGTGPKAPRQPGRKGYEQLQDYIFPVIRAMRNGESHMDAFKKTAKELNVTYNTVSAQCTRTLGITTDQFVSNGRMIDLLKRRNRPRTCLGYEA